MKIVAYGSLMNRISLERTMKRPVKLSEIIISGYRRIYNAPFDGFSYLNIQYQQGITMEAAYFALHADEIELFKEREAGSLLVGVLPGYFAFQWPLTLCKELSVPRSYITICEQGARELGINMWKGTLLPKEITEDTGDPVYCV
jgi:hypothetical protein